MIQDKICFTNIFDMVFSNRRCISIMELRVLNYFLVIAREENITKAAKQLHITQPTLSRQIAQLEDELGVKLFIRSNHHIILTEDGMILKRRAQELLALADKTKYDFLHQDENLEGLISIGCGEYQSTRLLTDCIAAFKKKYPHVTYEFYSGSARNIFDNIERGLLDMGLMSEPLDMQKFDFISMPVEEQWGLLVNKDSNLSKKEYIEPQDLAGISLILPQGRFQDMMLKKWMGEYYDQIEVTATGNLQYNETLFVESHIGAVVGIKLNYTYENISFIPFSPALKNNTALAWKKDEIFSPAIKEFIEFSKKYFKSISNDIK